MMMECLVKIHDDANVRASEQLLYEPRIERLPMSVALNKTRTDRNAIVKRNARNRLITRLDWRRYHQPGVSARTLSHGTRLSESRTP